MGSWFSPSGQDEPWFKVGVVDVTTTVLIAAAATLSMFVYAINPELLERLALNSFRIQAGQVWRLVTWPFLNIPDIWPLIAIVLFWLFGREVERLLGRRRYLWFLGFSVLIPSVVGTLYAIGFDLPLGIAGIGFLEYAVLTAFVAAYPTARSFFNIPLWVLGAVIVGLDVLRYTGNRLWQYLLFLLLVVAVAGVAAASFGVSAVEWIPKVPLPGFISGDPYAKANRRRARDQRRARASRDNVVQMPTPPSAGERARQADMDRLLDKISASGIDSLTPEERRRLDQYSRDLRGEG